MGTVPQTKSGLGTVQGTQIHPLPMLRTHAATPQITFRQQCLCRSKQIASFTFHWCIPGINTDQNTNKLHATLYMVDRQTDTDTPTLLSTILVIPNQWATALYRETHDITPWATRSLLTSQQVLFL